MPDCHRGRAWWTCNACCSDVEAGGWAMAEFRVPINQLRFKDPITAGLDPYTLMALVPLLRKTAEDHPAVAVNQLCPACGTWTVLDGRHRWIANVIAGRPDVLATEHTEPT